MAIYSKHLPKSERLKSQKDIQELFKKSSSSCYLYPFKLVYKFAVDIAPIPTENLLEISTENSSEKTNEKTNEKITQNNPPQLLPQLLFSVSKKSFKRAVDRNIIRRRIKEAYRLNKNLFLPNIKIPQHIGIIYIAKEIMEFADIQKKLIRVFGMIK